MKVTVIGAGIWGCWTAYLLQKAGVEVTLVDMWGPGNARAGSGGASRIIRLVYGADQVYVDMTQTSYELWEELEQSVYENLYQETGVLWMFADEDTSYLEASRSRIAQFGHRIHNLSHQEATQRYPQISFEGISRIFLEEKAGLLFANLCCKVLTREFQQLGGKFVWGEAHWNRARRWVEVSGDTLEADRYVFACGPWNQKLFPEVFQGISDTSRHEVYYLAVPNDQVSPYAYPAMPCWFEYNRNSPMFYGKPFHLGKGFKIAYDERSTPFDPDTSHRSTTPELLERSLKYVAKRFPGLAGRPLIEQRVCQYENSLDGHFIMAPHPDYGELVLLGGSSGHGFKVGPAVGKMTREYLLEGKGFPELFGLGRFGSAVERTSQFLQVGAGQDGGD